MAVVVTMDHNGITLTVERVGRRWLVRYDGRVQEDVFLDNALARVLAPSPSATRDLATLTVEILARQTHA